MQAKTEKKKRIGWKAQKKGHAIKKEGGDVPLGWPRQHSGNNSGEQAFWAFQGEKVSFAPLGSQTWPVRGNRLKEPEKKGIAPVRDWEKFSLWTFSGYLYGIRGRKRGVHCVAVTKGSNVSAEPQSKRTSNEELAAKTLPGIVGGEKNPGGPPKDRRWQIGTWASTPSKCQ